MNDPLSEEELAALFVCQRARDRERMPDFRAMRARALEAGAAVPPSSAVMWRWASSAAAALLLGFAVAGTIHHREMASAAARREAAMRELVRIDAALQKNLAARSDLTAWQSPTDFLLQPVHSETP